MIPIPEVAFLREGAKTQSRKVNRPVGFAPTLTVQFNCELIWHIIQVLLLCGFASSRLCVNSSLGGFAIGNRSAFR